MIADADMGPHGIPMSEATADANQFGFEVPPPTVDFAAKDLADAQAAHEKYYADQKRPTPHGLIWRVRLKGDHDAR